MYKPFHQSVLYACLCGALLSPFCHALAQQQWRLVWADEFDYTGCPDTARWDFEHGFVRNQELQWYQEDNARVADGVLRITARAESIANPHYEAGSHDWRRARREGAFTSACIHTRRHFSFRYGRLVVRARIPVASGAWPAIWTLGNRWGWPACGEIDVMEFYRVPPAQMGIHHETQSRERSVPVILANACWQGSNGRDAWNTTRTPYGHFTERDSLWAERFHTWSMDWTPDSISICLDDERLSLIATSESDRGGGRHHDVNPFANDVEGFGHYILLNLAIGSSGGTPDMAAFPMTYEVDYVRVYQRED